MSRSLGLPSPEAFPIALSKLLDEHGIELAIIAVRHPDSVGTWVHTRGDVAWRVGVWELQKADMLAEWIEKERE